MMFQLAWRNLWRNPGRTLVILTAVVIGVWSMVFFGALMRGMVDDMIDNGKSTLTGDIQIHAMGYRDDPSIEQSMAPPKTFEAMVQKLFPKTTRMASRIRVFGVVSNARNSRGITLVGIDPLKEPGVSFIGNTPMEGEFLKPHDDRGILLGRAMMETLGTSTGKKVILMSRDTNNEIVSRAFRIRGSFRAEMQATEKRFAFISLRAARTMLNAHSLVSEIAIKLPPDEDAQAYAELLKTRLSSTGHEILTWQDLLPMFKGYLELFDNFMLIWYGVIFVAMGFGIVNTTLMAVFERIREFGLLKALGMKPLAIVYSVLVESSILLIMGIATGDLIGLAFTGWLAHTGLDLSAFAAGTDYFGISRVIYPKLVTGDLVLSNLVVLVLGILVSLYPALKAARFTPVRAMGTL
ncbi:MAG: ABC transporter permease [Desulfobacteraceae bacterium]|nr:ABC transporter permease [Desulfobacteraceae bacterium]